MDTTEGRNVDDYFDAYQDLSVHKLMLEDNIRTETYKNAIVGNKEYFKDKVVMDVGCGTGILSIFCAQAGAKKVYAVEASNLAELAKEIVKENKFEDVIEVIHSKVEDISLHIKVDVIVSEWMGFYLLHEGMLDSVIVARDKFLNEDGEMYPSHASIHVAPCSLNEISNEWNNVHGVSMTKFGEKLREVSCHKPVIEVISEEELIGKEEELASFNLRSVTHEELNRLTIRRVIPASRDGNYDGLCLWWKCVFSKKSTGVQSWSILDTSPFAPRTHWKQTLLVLPRSITVEEEQPLAFDLTLYRTPDNERHYYIEMDALDPDEIEHPKPCDCYQTKCILTKAFMAEMDREHTDHEDDGIVEDDITDDQ